MVTGANGQVRTEVSFQSPWGTPVDQHRLNAAWQLYMDRQRTEGWRLVKKVRQYKTSGPVFNDDGNMMQEHVFEMILERAPTERTLDVPDSMVPKLLALGAKLKD